MNTGKHELPEKIIKIAESEFGITGLHDYQKNIILDICETCISDNNEKPCQSLTILPTGAGKSLCYMLPCFLITGYTLVIYPLNALIADQYKRFIEAGIEAAVIQGGMTRAERKKVLNHDFRAILTNPEALMQDDVKRMLLQKPPAHLVIDEAHTFAEWGTTFRPACLAAAEFIQHTGFLRMSAFTATASPSLLKEITAILFPSGAYNLFSQTPARENISFSLRLSGSRNADLYSLLITENLPRPLIIFCSTRGETEEASRMLSRYIEYKLIRFYHAGLSREEKQRAEKWFMAGGDKILISTCAFGLGVDARSVKTVIHRTAPSSVEAYIQESGRAGRDGSLCRAILLLGPEDFLLSRNGNADRRHQLLTAVSRENACRRVSLMALFSPESEHPPCGICDVCRGNVSPVPRGMYELLTVIAAFNGTLLSGETAEYLKSYCVFPGNGSLKQQLIYFNSWEYDWCQEIIEAAVLYGYLKKGWAFRKNSRRLRLSKQGKLLLKKTESPVRVENQ